MPYNRSIATYIPSEEDDTTEKIVDMIQNGQLQNWGLSIVRCTYASQFRWDRYISLIHRHIQERIYHDLLRSTLNCPIIEDRDRLDGATWKQARGIFDEWVVADIKANPPDYSKFSQPPPTEANKRLESDIYRAPRWEYFIYADQASMESILDCTEEDPWMSKGDCWLTIVTTGLKQPRQFFEDDNGVWIRDYEGDLSDGIDSWKGLCQKIKAMDVVPAYVDIVQGEIY